ncbi:MAG: hypothetical protein AUI57_10060 [Candidatus Rokubacteria bacterium 13_1_40CM_2_68_8]|nr:MAG: hypothetical protein AUI57_10060 [Candidatus Rokubacteria bacterium 13_1_40CM_2_68_8]
MTRNDLAGRWRADAAVLRRRGADQHAAVLESCAADLEAWARERDLEALTLEQAERESGYSYSALQKMVAAGRLRNVGESHRPRVRRGDLPKKARSMTPTACAGPDLANRVMTSRAAQKVDRHGL